MAQPQANPNGVTRAAKGLPRRSLLIAFAVAALFIALAVLGYRWAQRGDALATLIEFSGHTERDTARAVEKWRQATLGDDFREGDGARTEQGAVAHFRLINGARLKLAPASQIRFQTSVGKGSLKVDVDLGAADIESGAGSVTIASEFGDIVLDPQSSITMSRDGGRLNIEVDVGRIEIQDRSVPAGDSVELELGGIIVDVPVPTATASMTATAEQAPPEPELNVGDGVASADLLVKAGDTFVVHDPNPPTAIGFRLSSVCDGPARVVAGKQTTEGAEQASLRFAPGSHDYEVRCLDKPDVVAARGNVRVLHDAGTRKLPAFTPTASVTTDGRRYTVMYQNHLPRVTVSWPTAPSAERYTLKIDGREIATRSPSHTFASLRRGSHTVVFSASTTPARQSRSTTIDVVYDTQAPAARVSDPPIGFEPGEDVKISGQALPGWNVSVGDREVALDGQNNFSVELSSDGAIPITFSHPSRGTHYYLRRPKAAP